MARIWRTTEDNAMGRGRGRPGARLLQSATLSLWVWAVLALTLLSYALAQDEEASPTPTTTTASSLSSSSSSSASISSFSSLRSSSSSASTRTTSSATPTKSAWEVAPTVLLTDENVTYNFTLNRTSPAFLARFRDNITDRAVGVILNIGQLGSNASEPLPKVIVTTTDNYLPNDRRRSRISGGSARAGYNIGDDGAGSWQIVWDNGFGNWTYGIDREWNVRNHTAVAPSLLIGRGINDDIILDPSLVGGGNVTVYLGYTVLGERSPCREVADGRYATGRTLRLHQGGRDRRLPSLLRRFDCH